MKGILYTGGEVPLKKYIRHELDTAEIIVAADSGYDNAVLMGIDPDIIIGDLDSVGNRKEVFSSGKDKVLVYPEDKDETDTELGIKYLFSQGYDDIVLIGGGGGRMDHFLGILSIFDREMSPDIWYTHNTIIRKLTNRHLFHGLKGRTVSFFPAGNGECKAVTEGLKWPLDKLLWKKGDFGVSNKVVEGTLSVEIRQGWLIMITQLEEAES